MEGPHLEESIHLYMYMYMHVCFTFSSVVSLVMFADKRLQLLAMIIKLDEPDANKLWDYPALVVK